MDQPSNASRSAASSASSPRPRAPLRRLRRGAARSARRVSEPALPLLARGAARGARPAARRAAPRRRRRARRRPRRPAGSSARSASRCLPSRGVRWGSGLEPPPHLVGERARALDVLARRRPRLRRPRSRSPSRCRRRDARPAPIARRARRRARASTCSPRQLALAGYERVERVEERGQFAVRGGLVDVFPTTGREPLRIELFGDEIEGIRAFSPFTQRALRELDEALDLPGRRAARSIAVTLVDDEDARRGRAPCRRRTTSCRRSTAPPDFVWQPDEVRAVWAEEGLEPSCRSTARPSSTRSRRASRSRSTRSGRRSPRAGSPRPRTSSPACSAPASTSSSRSRTAARPSGSGTCCAASRPSMLEPGDELPTPAGSSSRSRRRGAASSGATSASRCSRTRRSSASARRARRADSAARSRASPTCAPATTSCTRTTASRSCSASRRRRSPASSRDYLLLAFRGEDRALRPARADRQGLALHRRRRAARRRSRSSAARPGTTSRTARASTCARWPASCSQLYAQRQTRPGVAYDVEQEWVERLEAEFPYRETEDQARAIEAVKEDLEAPHPMDRLVCGDVGFGKTEVALRAAFTVAVAGKQVLMLVPTTILAAAALEHVPRALPRLPGARRDGLALPQAGRGRSACSPSSPRARSTC